MLKLGKKETQTQLGGVIESGKKATTSGYYVYVGHSTESEDKGCLVTQKAREGLFIAKGSEMPDLGACPHKVKWMLDSA